MSGKNIATGNPLAVSMVATVTLTFDLTLKINTQQDLYLLLSNMHIKFDDWLCMQMSSIVLKKLLRCKGKYARL